MAKKVAKKVVNKSVKKSAPVSGKSTSKVLNRSSRSQVKAASAASAVGPPAVGSVAPDFTLPASDGTRVTLTGQRGRYVVLYFYPKADTPGCTTEACGFNASLHKLKQFGATVLGVSPDPIAAVEKFANKFKLGFVLLADEDHAVCERYGVWVEKSMYGKKYMGAARTTFVIDRDGLVAAVFEKVKPDGHDAEVLAWLESNVR